MIDKYQVNDVNWNFDDARPLKQPIRWEPSYLPEISDAFSSEELAIISSAEMQFVRLDDRVGAYPYKASLWKALNRVETAASVSLDGHLTLPNDVLRLESLARAGQADAAFIEGGYWKNDLSLTTTQNSARANAASETKNYIDMLNQFGILARMGSKLGIHHLRLLHKNALEGTYAEDRSGLRRRPASDSGIASGYRAPAPNKMLALLDEIMDFVNQPLYSPITQATIAYFQFMMIEPFFESNGVTGRSLAHLVLCKRGFTRNITVPFSVFPATRPDLYNMKLQPYRYLEHYSRSDIPRSMASCAVQLATYVEASIDIVLRYMDAIQDVQDEWRQRIPGLKMHSSIDRLLWRLPGEPLLTIPRAVKLTGKSFAAMNTCVSQLCEYGILRPATSGKRNRFFEAPDILEAYGEIESFYFPALEPRSDN